MFAQECSRIFKLFNRIEKWLNFRIWIFNVDFSSSDCDKVKTLDFIYREKQTFDRLLTLEWPLIWILMEYGLENTRYQRSINL